ncbi:psbP domain-containing protein 2, chloroplastic-like [Neltuma alba]|uniref:psbP domain-containing protein 2, chloroplastic-like n=1 Tax=Neltuma alba TaxID=207710 RepID=UPI0010A4411F|nr:psbP domain-containing protein 2, chloroplastic-like [Prosopis alba]XP_028785062.1 psbP domain-containing protein 2, chloroplastic-like [Prosopis alba]
MALTSSFTVLQSSLSLRRDGLIYSSPKTFVSILLSKPKSSLVTQNCNPRSSSDEPFLTKRMLNLTLVAMSICGLPDVSSALLAEEMELERYTDSKEGFTLLKPSSWMKVDKAGATVLFQEANMGSNNIGVVVNPVRLESLEKFGSPQFVADKLVQAEKRKESTKEAEVIKFAERSGGGGLPIYEFEYIIDSTRGGMKRIFSAAFVASKKLYLLNIVHSDKPESPLDPHKRMILEQVLHSFDAATLV